MLLVLRFARELPPDEMVAAIDRWGDLLRAVEVQPGPVSGEDALDAIGCYLLEVTGAPAHQLHAAFARTLTVLQDTIMNTADRLRSEGRAEGKLEGKREGKREGKLEAQVEILLRLLDKRFRPLPPDVVARVRAASAADLTAWMDRVVDAKALDEVFAGR